MSCLRTADIVALWERPGMAPESARHLLECPACQARERELQRLCQAMPLALAARPARRGADCLDPSDLLSLLADPAEEASARARAHAASCRHCAETIAQMIAAGRVGEPAADELLLAAARRARAVAAGATSGRSRRPVWAALAVAASLAGVAVGVRYSNPLPARGPETLELRATGAPAVPGAAVPAILAPREGATVAAAGLTLRWREVAGARCYTVTLLDASGTTVWRGEAHAASLALPGEVTLAPGGRHFAWVAAHLADGRTATGDAIGFDVAR